MIKPVGRSSSHITPPTSYTKELPTVLLSIGGDSVKISSSKNSTLEFSLVHWLLKVAPPDWFRFVPDFIGTLQETNELILTWQHQ